MVDEERWMLLWAHRDRLFAVARRRTVCHEDAEDVVMEAIVRCAEYANLDEARAGMFLTTVTVNACTDLARASRRRRTSRYVVAHGSEEVESSPEEAVCSVAEARWLASHAAALPARERAVLLGRAEGRSPSEIASELSATPRSVESALTRARRKLQRRTLDATGR